MSNNKQSMKLYTEEQVKEIVNRCMILGLSAETLLSTLTPLQLPSDEELIEVIENKFGKINPTLGTSDYRMGYESGLFDVVKLIQGGNNEKIINKITGL